jgi:DNA-directed RNA polymerase specialized sigma24 family protein
MSLLVPVRFRVRVLLVPQTAMAPNSPTNQQLWERVRYRESDNDPDALAAITEIDRRHGSAVIAYLRGRHAIAEEDSAQLALLKLWDDKTAQPTDALRGWLFTTAWRFDLNERRKRLQQGFDQSPTDFGEEDNAPLANLPAPEPVAEPAIDFEEFTLADWAAGLREILTPEQLSDKELEHFLIRCRYRKSALVCQYYEHTGKPWPSPNAEQKAWERLEKKLIRLLKKSA